VKENKPLHSPISFNYPQAWDALLLINLSCAQGFKSPQKEAKRPLPEPATWKNVFGKEGES
jgi:hypothetical protein